ncbi:uncharacterized protein LOC116026935 [Ipomoea triloba]|uniref:uncharacterized protein LOC116026935 n=1 Tax=Ipomoea triloba TaxID=35885 RepID=UPI00125DE0FA|nr:uncharacterized protein LOC116026935 [Ipomoea triloba]
MVYLVMWTVGPRYNLNRMSIESQLQSSSSRRFHNLVVSLYRGIPVRRLSLSPQCLHTGEASWLVLPSGGQSVYARILPVDQGNNDEGIRNVMVDSLPSDDFEHPPLRQLHCLLLSKQTQLWTIQIMG